MSAFVTPLLIAILPLVGVSILQFMLPVLGPLLTAEVGRAPEAYGWIGGSIALGTILFLLCNHAILPVLGPVRTLGLGLFSAIAGIALMLAGTWPAMIGGALAIGFGYGTTTPAGSQVLADFTPKYAWGTVFSLRQAAVPAGGVLAGVIGSWLIATSGWRLPLEVVMIVCAALAISLLLVPRRFNGQRALQPFKLAHVFDPANAARPLAIVRKVPGLPSLVSVGWALGFVHATVTSFFVTFLSSGVGVPLARAAFLFAIVQGCAIIGRIIFGAIADWFRSPMLVLKILAPLAATSAILLGSIDAAWSAVAQLTAAITIGMTVGTWNGLYLAEIARLAPSADVGEATAGASVFSFTAYLLAPPLVGKLATLIGYRLTFELVAVAAVCALVLLIWREREQDNAASVDASAACGPVTDEASPAQSEHRDTHRGPRT